MTWAWIVVSFASGGFVRPKESHSSAKSGGFFASVPMRSWGRSSEQVIEMAARKKPLHPIRIEEMREKIRATLLIKRLENHVFAEPQQEDFAKKAMTDSQVRAALGLLGKVLPNVSETKTELTGANGGDLRVITRIETVVIDPANSNG